MFKLFGLAEIMHFHSNLRENVFAMAFHLQFAREEFAMAELTVSGKTLTQFWKPSDIYPVTDSVVSDKVTGLADVAGV